MVSLAQLGALTFPVFGPANWLECGRAVYACVSDDDGQLFSLGLSHQVKVGERIAHLGVESFSSARRERSPATQGGRHVVTVDGTRHEVAFATDQQRPRGCFLHEGRTVQVESANWPLDGIELVRVDPTRYYADTLLSHWLE